MNAIIFQKLDTDFLRKDALDNFNRYQIIKRCWRKQGEEWVLTDNPFIEDWDTDQKRNVVSELTSCISNNGVVLGAICDNKIIGFASVSPALFGKNSEYIELPLIQVSAEYRHKGIGRKLFELIADNARLLGAKKIYISAHSSEESQAFYRSVGCVDAVEINKTIAENEPFDCQMEYVL